MFFKYIIVLNFWLKNYMLGLENIVVNACLEGCYTIIMTQVQGWVQILMCFIIYLL
jgi:hypothetical protein